MLAIPAVVAAVLYASMMFGYVLCDDLFVIKRLVGLDGEIAWHVAAEHFTGPWFGIGTVGYYRPIITLSWCLDGWLGSGSLVVFHATNVLLHCAAATLGAWLCWSCASSNRRLAALVGGLLIAVHPIAVEPVAAIASRTTTIEVSLRLASMIAFVRYLRAPSRARLGWTAGWAVLALLSKESALLTLPIAFVALDLMVGERRPLRRRAVPHALLAALWIGFFALRSSLVGGDNPMVRALVDRLLAFDFGGLIPKLGQLVAPSVSGGVEPMTVATAALTVLTILLALTTRRGRLVLAVGTLWILAQLVPTIVVQPAAGMNATRLIYGTMTAVALVFALLASHFPLRFRQWFLGVGIAAGATLALGTWNWSAEYHRAWDDARRLQRNIDSIAEGPRPLAFVTLGATTTSPALVTPDQIYLTTERPFAAGDYPTVNLTPISIGGTRLDSVDRLLGDASPLRAVARAGGQLLLATPGGLRSVQAAATEPPRVLRRDDRFVLDPPLGPIDIEGLELRSTPNTRLTGSLRWFAGERPAGLLPFTADTDREGVAQLDLVSRLDAVAPQLLGDVALSALEVRAPIDITAVRVVTRVPQLELARELAGATIELTALTAPTGDDPMRLVILGPASIYAQPVTPGQPVVIEPAIAELLRETLPFYRQKLYHYYFEQPSRGRFSRRSKLDAFRLE